MVTVAISGHRPGSKYPARALARTALISTLGALPKPLVLISALAEGADRDAAEAALTLGGALHVLTPFDHEAYKKDFADPQSLAAFDALIAKASQVETLASEIEAEGVHGDKRRAAYAAAGLAMLDRADLLVAVWDGAPGPYGGTSTIVAAARARAKPVIWIDAGGAATPRLLLGPEDAPRPFSAQAAVKAIEAYRSRQA